ncbi:peptidase C39 family protein [Mycetocola reblochoni]|uniref:GCN5-related N-acetyltransferase n=1 Tax=Mycetocola reblochoni REB411 TaxID=1255698 RepID=A0A1R4JHU3_9MICO|nr:peptidase C39 family protein [Mycetocola reblochoni]SJN31606.1 hypothetical protein FM119_07605 [Mycetocola reblochoni REB411]
MTADGTGAPVVAPLDDDALALLAARTGEEGLAARWSRPELAGHRPELVGVVDRSGRTSAALVTARPHTAYLKIVGTSGDADAAAAAVVTVAADRGLAKVVWEDRTGGEHRAPSGFTRLTPPLRTDDPRPPSGAVLWLGGRPPAEPSYYQQRTPVSCGAVAALLGDDALRRSGGGAARPGPAVTPEDETALWAAATNYPACEPVGLGVALRAARPGTALSVLLDADGPVMLEGFDAEGAQWRAARQGRSRARARQLGLEVDARPSGVPALRRMLERGEKVLTVLWLERMMGIAAPHWVLAHGVVAGAIVVQDPWVSDAAGESWVDAHLLPIADEEFDAMWRLHDGRSRGAVRLGPRAEG